MTDEMETWFERGVTDGLPVVPLFQPLTALGKLKLSTPLLDSVTRQATPGPIRSALAHVGVLGLGRVLYDWRVLVEVQARLVDSATLR